jgi:hypothetical protein
VEDGLLLPFASSFSFGFNGAPSHATDCVEGGLKAFCVNNSLFMRWIRAFFAMIFPCARLHAQVCKYIALLYFPLMPGWLV